MFYSKIININKELDVYDKNIKLIFSIRIYIDVPLLNLIYAFIGLCY